MSSISKKNKEQLALERNCSEHVKIICMYDVLINSTKEDYYTLKVIACSCFRYIRESKFEYYISFLGYLRHIAYSSAFKHLQFNTPLNNFNLDEQLEAL